MRTIIGAYLIDAPFSALNNSGIDKRAGNENRVLTKTIRTPEGLRPYVSAQAIRYWWRNILELKYNWNISPVERLEKQAVTKTDPLQYEDDDIFGYMYARKEKKEKSEKTKGKTKEKDLTVTRVSPLKCSPLIGLPLSPEMDYGVMRRSFEGDSVPYEHQFYSNILKGIFAIDLDSAGVFTSYDKPGCKNLSGDLVNICREKGYEKEENKFILPLDIRKKRVTDTLSALKYLNGGAMQTLHHTDVTPKAIVLACINSGNNIFMDIFPHNDYDAGLINTDALSEVLEDYSNDLLSEVYIGWMSGFGTEKDLELQHFRAPEGVKVNITTPAKAIDGLASELSIKTGMFGD